MRIFTLLSHLLLEINLASALNKHDLRHVKRGGKTDATLYAYGADSAGWPIAYGLDDGLLYIAEDPDNSEANLTPLTWDLASITDECWIANATFINGKRAGCMYIMDEREYAVGILPQTRVAYVNGTVTGFGLFASQLVYNNNTLLQAQFWARATNFTDTYGLTWTLDDGEPSGEFPVVVKASTTST
ncbi:hypothetical protein BO82DRAFT_437316 [Aspergillus uvarum CBS 121591]|uniref:Uncharacterized protein n=1 Tax=Aspergillus uvarum CBS 121591 TaxID=1448315 RepID=A0A319BSB3_9EURO|nr:hypothetical protein BO82DRAFT_437316 [Aspergillus uvarum CBS 121591]PYH75565.1 hypothetical protein BO82DRAFT_437316 [Aspergillus uvarum CBS 121591]